MTLQNIAVKLENIVETLDCTEAKMVNIAVTKESTLVKLASTSEKLGYMLEKLANI